MTAAGWARRPFLAVATLFAGLVLCGVASAFWSTTGTGVAAASTTTLAAPTNVTVTVLGSTVTVGFTGVAAPSGSVDGYVVTRYQGVNPSNACGTNPAVSGTWLSAATFTCDDPGLTAGTYTYRVTAMFRSWTAQSAASPNATVAADATAPTQVVSVASGNAYLNGSTVYYRTGAPGSFTLQSVVTDSGSGPASANFPALTGGANAVTHTARLHAHQTGPLPSRTYTSNTFQWSVNNPTNPGGTYTITGRDVATNPVTTAITFAQDNVGPTGGALNVNGSVATTGGTQTNNTSGSVVVTSTPYGTDAGSGLDTSTLTREFAPWAAGVCGAYGPPASTTAGTHALADGCYRYRLTGTDQLGNVSTLSSVVRVDSTHPTVTLVVNPITNGPGWYDENANVLWVDKNPTGSFTISAVVDDGGSGPASAQFRAGNTGWNHTAVTRTFTVGGANWPTATGTSNTWTWNSATNGQLPGSTNRTVTVVDQLGNSTDLTPTWSIDNDNPTGGALTVNGQAANAVGTSSNTAATNWTIGARTDWTDAGSGLVAPGSVLTRQSATWNGLVCGTFGSATTVTGSPNQNGMSASTCYRYTLAATDNLGHLSSISTTVRVNPAGPYVTNMTLNDVAGNDDQMDNDDTIVITFSEQMDVSTFCSTWTNDNANQAITANNTVYVRLTNGNAADDYLEVRTTAGACGGAFNFGRITLGDTGHITNNPWTDFGGTGGNASTIAWNVAARTLTITLGEGSVGPGTLSNDVGNYVATYAPHTAIRGTASAVLPVWNTYLTGDVSHF